MLLKKLKIENETPSKLKDAVLTPYLSALSSVSIFADIRHCSMAEYHEEKDLLHDLYVELSIAIQSINRIYTLLVELPDEIDNYLKTCLSWEDWAADNRVKTIAEYGSDNDLDYNSKGEVIKKWDKESLEGYFFTDELKSKYFGNGSRGEYLGTSKPSDFSNISVKIYNSTDLKPIKILQGIGFKVQESNECLTARLEQEINEGAKNASIVDKFNFMLGCCIAMKEIIESKPIEEEFNTVKDLKEIAEGILNCEIPMSF